MRGGWSLAVCEIDLKVGGAYRYVWRGPDGKEMGMGGVFHEIVRPERVVATEKFDDAWYPGEALDTTVLVEQGGKTTLTLTVRYESKEARDSVLKGPMARGSRGELRRAGGGAGVDGVSASSAGRPLAVTHAGRSPSNRWGSASDPRYLCPRRQVFQPLLVFRIV